MIRYRCVDDQKAAGFPVSAACDAAGVSTSGFYDWRAREAAGPTERQVAEAELVELMRDIFDASDGNYGVPRMHDELRRAGLKVNEKRVRRLMRLHGMAGRCRRRRCQTTFPGPDGYVIPDLIGRCFEPGKPDTAWCRTSPTSRPGRAGCTWHRCSISAPVGCSATRWPSTCAPSSSWTHSAWRSPPAVAPSAGVIAHADRGSQYTSNDYLEFCQQHQLRPSVGRTGVCWDNAVAESFWESLKRECLQGRVFPTRAEARRAIFRWINWYNTTRLHTSLNSVPPIEWEQQYRQAS